MSVILLGGSPSSQSSCSRLLQHVGEKLAVHGWRTTRLEVRELPGPALLRMDAHDPELARAMGGNAARRFEEVFTSAQMAADYTALYREVLARHAGAPHAPATPLAPPVTPE